MTARNLVSTLLLSAALGLIAATCLADDRPTKAITLDNEMRVVLISDMDADVAGASLAVGIGAMGDGDYPGIAHFLEHMLFLGTEKYPDPADYKNYLAENDGSSNAYTAEDHTNYMFEVKPDAFEGALDRYAQFFIAPLMTDTLSSREVNAVDSEHSKNLENDFWRRRQIFRELTNPEHPRHTFSTGSAETLKTVRNETLRAFYDEHYSANRMALCVIAPEPLATLEKWTREKFSAVENKKLKPFEVKGRMFTQMAGKRVNVESVQDIRELRLHFELDADSFDYKSKPDSIIGSVLGHEGRESLLAYLKDEGWATGLSGGANRVGPTGTFDITIQLTAGGLEHIDAVAERIFGMINHLRSLDRLPDHVIREAQEMAEIGLRFRQPGRPFQEGTFFARSMMTHPHENLLEHVMLIPSPDHAKNKHLLEQLRPDNAVMFVNAQNLETDRKEEHYGSDYGVTAFSPELMARFKNAKPTGRMGVPAPNRFIPDDFDLVATSNADEPHVHEWRGGELWLRHDTNFEQPKASLRVEAQNPLHAASARDFALGKLFAEAATEALNPHLYPAALAGLGASFSSDRGGLTVNVSGYSDRIDELLEFAAPYLTEVKIDEKKFEIIKEKQLRALRNKVKQPASQHAFDLFRQVIREVNWNDEQQIEALESVGYADLKDYVKRSREQVYLQGFVYGNMTTRDIRNLAKTMRASLGGRRVLAEEDRFYPRVLKLSPGTSAILTKQIDSNDSATVLMYQGDPMSEEQRAIQRITSQLASNEFFQDLRTLQQTGYIVGAAGIDVEGLPIFYFLSQSSVVDTTSLRGRFEMFIKHFVDDLKELDEEEFERNRAAAIAAVLKKRTSFGEELNFNFEAAFKRGGDFEYLEREAEALKNLTFEGFKAAVPAFFAEDSVRRVSIEVIGASDRQRFQEQGLQDIRDNAEGYWQRPAPQAKAMGALSGL